jgi:Icc protein
LPSVSSPAIDSPVLLVQLSDSHLVAEADGAMFGLNTRDSLAQVVERVLVEQPNIDLLVATGDLSQDGTLASYQAFAQATEAIAAPMRWLPGNHDEPAVMQQAAQGTQWLDPVIDVGGWRVTLLDSAIAGSAAGYLPDDQLQLLEQALSEAPQKHHLVCLHHHPVPIDSQWMEPIGLRNPQALLELLARFPQARGVLWGHVHQEIDREAYGLRLLASPSTCIQFLPHSETFALDDRAPGYRWLRLMPDGQIETGVSRLPGFDFTPDLSADGY